MTETTSSAIIMVTSVLIACIVISLFIFSYKRVGAMNEASETRQEEMDIKNTDDELYKYAGSTIDGYKLQSLLKSLASNSDVKVVIKNVYMENNISCQFTITCDFSKAGKIKDAAGKAFRTDYKDTRFGDTASTTRNIREYFDFYTLEDNEENRIEGRAESEPVSKMILNPERPDWYINPFGKFYCDAETVGESVKTLTFTRKE